MAQTREYHGKLSKGNLSKDKIEQVVIKEGREYMAIKKQLGNVENHL